MIDLLRPNPLLLLFPVAAIGCPLGQVKSGEANLGLAAVLFVGLAPLTPNGRCRRWCSSSAWCWAWDWPAGR